MKRLLLILLLLAPIAGADDLTEADITAAYYAADRAALEDYSGRVSGDYLAAYTAWRIGTLLLDAGESDAADAVLLSAQQQLENLTGSFPRNAEAWALLATVIGMRIGVSPGKRGMRFGPQSDRAGKTALELEPDNPRALLLVGINKYNTPRLFGGGRKKALRFLDRAAAAWNEQGAGAYGWGEPEIHVWRGRVYLRSGKTERACAEFDRAIDLAPDYAWVRSLRASIDPADCTPR